MVSRGGGGRGLLGAYELGRTLGEGNFGKVKQARHRGSGAQFAVKILDRARVVSQRVDDQIRREIATLKLLAHPNVVRLHEIAASKTKIYMVLELVNGGELFDRIASKGKLPEQEARRLFQQLIDGVSYCHEKGVYHQGRICQGGCRGSSPPYPGCTLRAPLSPPMIFCAIDKRKEGLVSWRRRSKTGLVVWWKKSSSWAIFLTLWNRGLS